MAEKGRQPRGLLALLAALFLSGASLCSAFKAHEFKTCGQAHFCKRNREKGAGNSTIALKSGALQGGRFVGTLTDSAFENVEFSLEISSYGPGIVRVKIDEQPSKGRFQVPDVLDPELASRWTPLEQGGSWSITGPPATVLKAGDHELTIGQSPFSVHVRTTAGGEDILSLNSHGLLGFEHLRAKPEGGADTSGLWEEDFRGNKDSKPKGPEAISLDVTFHGVQHVYGIPERATSLALKATRGVAPVSEPYRLYNLDVFEYDAESPFGLYGSIPFMMGHRAARSAGFFWLNAAEMWVDVLEPGWDGGAAREHQVETHWIAESGILDAFLFLGPSPKDVLQQYTAVTATMAMPQLFAIAYHQCRWNYKDEADVANVNHGFEVHDIPYDTLWLDIEHTDGKKYMTWDPVHFPHPVEMQNKIGATGRHMVTIVDPHMKRDSSYPIYTESTEKGYFVKSAGGGGDFDGWCWPGSSSYLDVLSPEIRAWWATKFSYASYKGSTPILQIWNDMNEPSVFNGPEVTMPKDALHVGGVEHRDVHNAYGYYYHLASHQGLLHRDGGRQRPFVLSRAKFAGTQRAGPVWTGDNSADWDHLKKSVPMVVTLGLAGIAFSGADVGGFFGNPDAELLTRWFQLGAYYPFFRGHAHLDTKRREPWVFGEPYTSHIREAIRARYALLPYFYTLFREAFLRGTPVMRPLFMEFPSEAATFARDDSFLIGHAMLVRGVMDPGVTSVEVYLPGEEPWYEAKTGRGFLPGRQRTISLEVGLDTVPVFQKGGTIVPRKDRPRRSSTQMEADPFTLVVALDSKGEAEGELYLDDGQSYDFKEGAYIHRRFRFAGGYLESSDGAPPGSKGGGKAFATDCRVERIVVMGMDQRALSRNVRATLESAGVDISEEMGPPLVRPGVPPSALVVRAPGVGIADDWKIKVFS